LLGTHLLYAFNKCKLKLIQNYNSKNVVVKTGSQGFCNMQKSFKFEKTFCFSYLFQLKSSSSLNKKKGWTYQLIVLQFFFSNHILGEYLLWSDFLGRGKGWCSSIVWTRFEFRFTNLYSNSNLKIFLNQSEGGFNIILILRTFKVEFKK